MSCSASCMCVTTFRRSRSNPVRAVISFKSLKNQKFGSCHFFFCHVHFPLDKKVFQIRMDIPIKQQGFKATCHLIEFKCIMIYPLTHAQLNLVCAAVFLSCNDILKAQHLSLAQSPFPESWDRKRKELGAIFSALYSHWCTIPILQYFEESFFSPLQWREMLEKMLLACCGCTQCSQLFVCSLERVVNSPV